MQVYSLKLTVKNVAQRLVELYDAGRLTNPQVIDKAVRLKALPKPYVLADVLAILTGRIDEPKCVECGLEKSSGILLADGEVFVCKDCLLQAVTEIG